MLRVKEFGLEIKTQKGKKGREKGRVTTGARSTRAQKFQENPDIKDALVTMHDSVPPKYKQLVKKIEKGSLKAAVKLKCLDCSGFDPKEIKYCTVKSCSLYPFRPYQVKHGPKN